MSEELRLKLVLQAKDGLSNVIKQATRASDKDFEKLQNRLDKTAEKFESFGKKSTIAGAGLIAVSGAGAKMAGDFQSSMTNVSTLIDTNTESLDEMGKKVLDISKTTPVAINDLTNALYNIRSAGIDAKNQFTVLEKSAQLGIAGLGSTDEAVDLVTSSINAWQLEGEKAQKVYDNIFRTVKTGKTTISGIAQGFGAVAGTVAASGIELDDYLASVAALTTTGQPAAQAHTQIKAAISGMTRESKESKKILTQLGASSFKDLVQKSGGMVDAFMKITKAVGGNDAMILSLFGSTEAYNAVVGLCTKQNKAYTETLKGMRDGTNAVDEAFEKQAGTMNNSSQTLKNSFQSLGIEFGNGLLPVITTASKGLKSLSDIMEQIPQPLKSVISVATLGTGVVLTGLGTTSMLIGASIRGFKDMLGVYREADVWLWANGIKLKNINIDIKKRFAGIAKGFKAIPNLMTSVITKVNGGCDAMINFFMNAPQNAFNAVKNGINGIKNGFVNFIPNCKKAITSMRALNLTMSLNPVGLIAAGVIAGAFLIYKYWTPISSFFKGVFTGIKTGLAPLQPTFNAIGTAIKPAVEWIKAFFSPIKSDGKEAEQWGIKFGKGIAFAITKMVEAVKWVKDLITLGGKLNFGQKEKSGTGTKIDGSHANGLDNVPYDGYIAKVHKKESILTAPEASQWRNHKRSGNKNNITLNYSPVVNIANATKETKDEFLNELRKHKREILTMLMEMQRRKEVRVYG